MSKQSVIMSFGLRCLTDKTACSMKEVGNLGIDTFNQIWVLRPNFLEWLSLLGSGYLIWEHPPKMQTRCVCIHLLAYENFSGWIHKHPVPSVANMDKKISYFIYPCSENNVTPDISPSLGLTDVLTLFKPCAVFFFFIQSTNQKLTDTYLAVINRILKCGGIFMSGHASRSSHLPVWLTHTIQRV